MDNQQWLKSPTCGSGFPPSLPYIRSVWLTLSGLIASDACVIDADVEDRGRDQAGVGRGCEVGVTERDIRYECGL